MNKPSTNFHLIPLRTVARYRTGGRNEQGNDFRLTTASGRSKCRCCGQRIAKGEWCLEGWHDFGGCGSWTSSQAYLHPVCPKPAHPVCPWCKEPLDGPIDGHDVTCPWRGSAFEKQIRQVLDLKEI